MGVCRRAARYLARKKGKAALLFLIFFFISALLLICFSVLDGTGQAARDLRSNIGAAFTIRPYAQMTLEDGEISQGTTPSISQQSIDEVIAAARGQVKAYNTEHYGYAKNDQLHFLPGARDNEASNMGIDPQRCQVWRAGSLIGLTPMEFDILHLLARHPGQVFSARQIYESVASDFAEGSWSGIGNMVCKLRCKIGSEAIRTVRSCGYCLIAGKLGIK